MKQMYAMADPGKDPLIGMRAGPSIDQHRARIEAERVIDDEEHSVSEEKFRKMVARLIIGVGGALLLFLGAGVIGGLLLIYFGW